MLLQRISLDNFKRFKHIDHEFRPGINVIKGPLNETGKSTLLEGIKVSLFDNPKSTSKDLDTYQRWGSENKSKTLVEFNHDGNEYVLEKDFNAKTIILTDKITGDEWKTVKEINEKLSQVIGTISSDLFLSTSIIRQDEIREISAGKKQIGASLEEIVTGGSEHTTAASIITNLSKKISQLTKGMERLTRSPGEVARLSQELEQQERKLDAIKVEVNDVEDQKIQMVDSQNALNEIEVKLGEIESLLKKNKQRQDIETRIEYFESEFNEVYQTINEIKSMESDSRKAKEELSKIDGFSDSDLIEEVRTSLIRLEAEHKKISSDLELVEHEAETITSQFERKAASKRLSSKTSLVIGVTVAIFGFAGFFIHPAIIAVGIAGLVYIIAALLVRNSINQLVERLSQMQNRVTQMQDGLKNSELAIQGYLSKVNCESVSEFRERDKEYTRLQNAFVAAENRLIGKRGSQTIEQREKEQNEKARSLAEERSKLTDDLKNTKISPSEYVQLEREAEQLRSRQKEYIETIKECEISIRKARYNADDLTRYEEILESTTNRLIREKHRLKVLQLTQEFIASARDNTLTSANDLLEGEIQLFFETFTRGKYKQVKHGDDTLDFQIFSEEKGDWAKPEELSGGAIDEFYLACRIALARLIFDLNKPPLILDDPFTNFDEPRLTNTIESLKSLSNEHQVIIFTLRNDLDTLADHLIELPV